MCGIAGIVTLDGHSRNNALFLHNMGKCMKSRGPNDEGYLIASYQNNRVYLFKGNDTLPSDRPISFYPTQDINRAYNNIKGNIFLAHRRLSIIDLSPYAHQPMCTSNGRFWIIYNGELYNYREIASELKKRGVNFVSNSDTEVLLYAYQEWGPEALKYFNGMFSFAIWDNRNKTLFCARDRIGIKPFYYTIKDNQFIFASDIKTLISSTLYKPAINIEGLYHALSFGVAPRPLTAFKDVYSLEQGHWLLIKSDGTIKKDNYWEIPLNSQKQKMHEKEAITLLESQLFKAIEYRLVADVPVGTFMSGGIDSTTVSAIASKLHPGIKAFTLVFSKDKKLDESKQAKATAAMCNMEHIIQDIEIDSVLEYIDEMIECYEEPFYDLSPNYVISRMVYQNNVTVILNGLGGDELFGGYPYYRWIKRWKLLQKVKPFLGLTQKIPLTRHISERLLAISFSNTADRYATAVRAFFTDKEKQKLFLDQSVREFNTIERIHQLYVGNDKEFTDLIEAISYIDMKNYIGNHHVYRVDKFTMHFSLEGRLPFLDHNLVELAFKMPSFLKVNSKGQKYILRKVAEKYIHPLCTKAKKKGFDFPTDRWMRTNLKELVKQKLTLLSQRGIFNPKIIWQTYWEWKLKARSFRSVWELVSTEMWIEKFIDGNKNI